MADELLAKWCDSVDRVVRAGKTLVDGIKLLETEGPTAGIAMDVCEKTREALGLAFRHEGIAWRKLNSAKDQTEMSLGAEAVPAGGPQGVVVPESRRIGGNGLAVRSGDPDDPGANQP